MQRPVSNLTRTASAPRLIGLLGVVAMLTPFAILLPALDASAQSRDPDQVTRIGLAGAQGLHLLRRVEPRTHQCVEHTIECGETVVADITTHDCETMGTYFDFYFFDGVAGQTITATMTSTAFDPFLYLYYPDLSFIDDDNSGPGLAARIVHTLEETSSDWSLGATPLDAGLTGPYTLSLECSGGEPPPPPPPEDGFFTDPEYPDFRFKVEITPAGQPPIDGTHLTDCQEDTVCVAGAVPDRPELFIRILGPRPNGFLWPTLVRFTPSAVRVEIEQISTGARQTYELDAVGPGDENLSGLQDRMGFQP